MKPHGNKGRPSKLRGRGRNLVWLKERVSHDGDTCLIWPFSKNHQGYGQIGYFGKVKKAHHIMCLLIHGPAPSTRHEAAHNCGKGHLGCVHPKHVEWKTPAENRADTIRHGTNPKKVTRRLTIDLVEEIRASGRSCVDLAKQYRVSIAAIFKIRRGETWVKPRSMLTGDQLRKIRELDSAGAKTSEISEAVGLSYSIIWRLRTNQNFRER